MSQKHSDFNYEWKTNLGGKFESPGGSFQTERQHRG